MAGKFRIFCDDCPTNFEPEDKPMVSAQSNSQQQVALKPIKPSTTISSSTNDHQQMLSKLSATTSTNNSSNQHEQEKFIALHGAGGGGGGPLQPLASKREPLGLRQAISQASAALVEAHSNASQSAATNSSSSSALTEEDQENDISMASLGSDFVPSIIHEDEFDNRSFEVEEEEEIDDEAGEFELSDEFDDDFEDDEEFRMELSQAFKQHDDSQLFKTTVYIDDIESYLQQLERKPDLRPLPNYMDLQNDIDSNKRAILINWLVEVSDEYNLNTETLFICIGLIDRFLSVMSVPTSNFQLLGVAAMFIASKYEEIYPPNLYQFVSVTDDTYSGQQIRLMEQDILKTLEFRISLPTVSFFLRQIFAFNKFPKKVFHLAEYLCYLSLLADQPILEYYPSEIALAAVILAAYQLDAETNVSSELRTAYEKSNADQLKRRKLPKGVRLDKIDRRSYTINRELPFCIEALRALQEHAFKKSSNPSFTAIVQRFSLESSSNVALLLPPKVEELYSI